MGAVFKDLTCEELCDLMCGAPEQDYEEDPAALKIISQTIVWRDIPMDIFKTENNRTYIAIDAGVPKDWALTEANSHFCTSIKRLGIDYCWVKDDTLYFKKTNGAKKHWLIWRKTNKELKEQG